MTNQNFAQSFDHFPAHEHEMYHESHNLNPTVKRHPKLAVFDLDYTVWPFHVYDLVAPFKRIGQKVLDSNGMVIKYYQDVPRILEYLREHNILVAAVSTTVRILHVQNILEMIGVARYFDHKEIYPRQKTKHLKNLKEATGIDYKDMIYFDDEQEHVNDISKLGVTATRVENRMGITHETFEKGLKKWARNN
ncbi:hypothetical protein M8J76_012686 [Diaphorina citri]|nr:hypothetical protein M8J75_011482 [Diaphorina citri]KAI5730351.1 hypothetical protein M8J76_012686 [Diaphorina citri]KAI5735338.1 hypothetical protein M8J77_017130 [Diaphorina citri]